MFTRILVVFAALIFIKNIYADVRIVETINKDCESVKTMSIIDYSICDDWKLTSNDLLKIWEGKKEIYFPGVNYGFIHSYDIDDDSIRVNAVIKDNDTFYEVNLGSNSWVYTINLKSGENKLFTYDNKDGVFIYSYADGSSEYGYEERLLDPNSRTSVQLRKVNELMNVKNNVEFAGTYEHEYFEISISDKECILEYYNADLVESISCYMHLFDDGLYVYSSLNESFEYKERQYIFKGEFLGIIKDGEITWNKSLF